MIILVLAVIGMIQIWVVPVRRLKSGINVGWNLSLIGILF